MVTWYDSHGTGSPSRSVLRLEVSGTTDDCGLRPNKLFFISGIRFVSNVKFIVCMFRCLGFSFATTLITAIVIRFPYTFAWCHRNHSGASLRRIRLISFPRTMTTTTNNPKAGQASTLTFVTGNQKKLEEVQSILSAKGSFPFQLTNQKIELPELQGDDPIAIAEAKCRLAAQQVRGPCITEDTSLCFDALNGLPGPYIKWFLEKCGHDGLNKMLVGFANTKAYAQTVFAFTTGPEQPVHIFDGRTEGCIVPARGSLDFGWDPIFEPVEGQGKTYAEMSTAEKNTISHRSRSLGKLYSYLVENADAIERAIATQPTKVKIEKN